MKRRTWIALTAVVVVVVSAAAAGAATRLSSNTKASPWIPGTVWGVMPQGTRLTVQCPAYLTYGRTSSKSATLICGSFFRPFGSSSNAAQVPAAPTPDAWQLFHLGVMQAGQIWKMDCPNFLRLSRITTSMVNVVCSAAQSAATTTSTVAGATTTVPPTTTSADPTTTVAPTTTTTKPVTTTSPPPPSPGPGNCQIANPAFCDTFDSARTGGGRAGDLGSGWGASRFDAGQNVVSPSDNWMNASVSICGATTPIRPPGDIRICNGHLFDTLSEDGVKSLAMYPKQPFDFAGRTGTIAFDVSDDSQGSHAAWPELWMSDKPVPDPFTHFSSDLTVPQNGFGIRFAGCGNTCPRGTGAVGVDSAITVSNYVENDEANNGTLQTVHVGDMLKPTAPGQLNHIEVQVNVGQLTIFGTDAYDPATQAQPPLHEIAYVPNANLSFTRGLVWLEDAHYAACKFNSQCNHVFEWDNLGFDGPVLRKDLGFDVPDCNCNGGDLGYSVTPGNSTTVVAPNVTGMANASAALLVFDEWSEQSGFTVHASINGQPVDVTPPFNTNSFAATVGIPIPLSDVVAGDNQITFTVDSGVEMNFANVSIILVGAGG